MRGAIVLVGLTGLFLFGTDAARGQASEKLEFEVATVRPVTQRPLGGGTRVGPGTQDPERWTVPFSRLRDLLLIAFDVRSDQFSGPAWMDSEHYSIVAKVPPGTSKEQFLVMQQKLLVDRFKITMHHVRKDFVVYDMDVAKNGLKLERSSVDLSAPNTYKRGDSLKQDKDGFPILPGNFKYEMGTQSGGQTKQTWRGWSLSDIATIIENHMGSSMRVTDKTGLTGLYDFHLQFATPTSSPVALGQAVPDTSDPAADFLSAVQTQLGLKLVKGTASLDVIVIDSADRAPVEN